MVSAFNRMVIGKYRFLETMGEGGESNPCYKPLFDETIDAPLPHKVEIDGTVKERRSTQSHTVDEHLTIGPARNFMAKAGDSDVTANENEKEADDNKKRSSTAALSELFQPPE